MAIDEAILEAHIAGSASPTVRLYGWNPPAVSIGYSQKFSDDAIARITKYGMDVVRRPTGGRAVLHWHELTYSFVGSSVASSVASSIGSIAAVPGALDPSATEIQQLAANGFLSPTIIGAYKEICHGLMLALQEFGVDTELGASDSSYRQMHDCFLATTTADLHFKGKKMVGSAQCRRGVGVLQHGSILLDQPQQLMEYLLIGRGEEVSVDASPNKERHANLFDAMNRVASTSELSNAIKRGFETAFEIELVAGEITDHEMRTAEQLREKFEVARAETVPS